MTKLCDNKSVGMIVWRKSDGALLLIERKKYPFGFACPAGHVDNDPDFETSAKRELKEEVGLDATNLQLIWSCKLNNPCRREGGTWHDWEIYQVYVENEEVKRSLDETKSFRWASSAELDSLADRTRSYLRKEIPEEEWQKSPGLEPVWFQLLAECGYLSWDSSKENLPYSTP